MVIPPKVRESGGPGAPGMTTTPRTNRVTTIPGLADVERELCQSTRAPPMRALSLRSKGSLRRAQTKRALDGCGPLRSNHSRDGRLRRENQNTPTLGSTAAICLRSTGRSSPIWTATRRNSSLWATITVSRPAGSTPIQSSWTASRCSRKWMSGPATPWTQSPTGRQKQIVTATRTARRALQEPSVKCREISYRAQDLVLSQTRRRRF